MPATLAEMATKGYTKATAKDASIKASWAAAKERCIANYEKQPFGPTRKANHAAVVRAATHRTDWDKWKTNWQAIPLDYLSMGLKDGRVSLCIQPVRLHLPSTCD